MMQAEKALCNKKQKHHNKMADERNFDDSRIFALSVTNASLFLNGDNYSEVQFQIPAFIVRHSNNYATYVSIENATIPSSWYVIDLSNNFLHVSIEHEISSIETGTATMLLYIQPGTYDAYSLLTVINEELPALLTGIATLGFSEAQNKFTVVWTNAVSNIISLTFHSDSTCAYNLGFDSQDYISTPMANNTHTFPNQCNLTGVNSYLIKCDELPIQNYSLQVASSIIGSIQNVAGTFGLTTWQNASDLKFLLNIHRDINQLTFRIYNERGELINFHKSPWSLTLKVTYHRKSIVPYKEIHQLLHPPVVYNPPAKRKNLKRNATISLQEDENQDQINPQPFQQPLQDPEMGAMEGLEPPLS